MTTTAMASFVFTFACLTSVSYARTSGDTLHLLDLELDQPAARLAKLMAQSSLQSQAKPRIERSDLALMLLSTALAPQHAPTRSLPKAVMKAAPPVNTGAPPIAEGSIVFFEEPKRKQKLLGLVWTVETKKKKGETYIVRDADGKDHGVLPKQVYCAFEKTAKVSLSDYIRMDERKPSDLGVEITDLDLVWEMVADETSLSLEAIMDQIDSEICKTGPGKYWAFKFLTSYIGKIYFKRLHSKDYRHVEFKPKPAESVQASKEHWCSEVASANPKIKTMPVFQDMCLI
jgi:hypothetical protein